MDARRIERIRKIVLEEVDNKYSVRFCPSKSTESLYCTIHTFDDSIKFKIRFSDHLSRRHIKTCTNFSSSSVRKFIRKALKSMELRKVQLLFNSI